MEAFNGFSHAFIHDMLKRIRPHRSHVEWCRLMVGKGHEVSVINRGLVKEM